MNWKLLSITLLGLSLVACEGKKEEKKAEDATAPAAEAMKAEEPKADAMKAEEPKADAMKTEEPKAAEPAPVEASTEEKKAS